MIKKFIPPTLGFCLGFCLSFQVNHAGAQSNPTITSATQQFLKTLNSDEIKKTTYLFADTTRLKWTNLPVGLVPRAGIQYGSLSDTSRLAFHRVLTAALSSQG